MKRVSIPPQGFMAEPHSLFDQRWFLLCCGDFEKQHFNHMTISWGSLGTLWNLPIAMVVVRFSRLTFEFMEKYDTFTLNSFPEKYHKELNILGSKSGREIDKIHPVGLTPIASRLVKAPSFKQADLVLECKKIYWDDMNPAHFLDTRIHDRYPTRDYHRIYLGEVLGIFGNKKHRK